MPAPTHYGSLHIPEGYIPPSVNPPVVPPEVISSTTESEYWRRPGPPQHGHHPSQGHYRRPSRSHTPVQPVNPAVMPSQPFTEPTTSTRTSSLSSPPFKPFRPLPEITRTRPPPPPPRLLDLAPYRDSLSYLSHPSPGSKTEALEIIRNRDRRDIHRAREEWRREDEARARTIREKKEERERIISGANTINAPTMQTVTALVVDPATAQQPPPPPKKEKKSFWKRLLRPGKSDRNKQQPAVNRTVLANGPVVIPIGPQQVLASIPGVVGPVQMTSQSQTSSSLTDQSSGSTLQPTSAPPVIPISPGRTRTGPVIPGAIGQQSPMPSPFLHPTGRSTSPDISPPPTAAFFTMPAPINV